MKFFLLYTITAAAEFAGFDSAYAWLRFGRSAWWLVPSALTLADNLQIKKTTIA